MWGGPGAPQNPWLQNVTVPGGGGAGAGVPQHPQQQQQQQQWSLNPTHYANIPHSQGKSRFSFSRLPVNLFSLPLSSVDWAALAQQWMMLKGAVGPTPTSIAHAVTVASSIGGADWNRQGGGSFGGNVTVASGDHQHHLHHQNQHQQNHNRGPFHHLGRGGGNGEGIRINPVGDIIEEAPMELEPLDQEPQPSSIGKGVVQ